MQRIVFILLFFFSSIIAKSQNFVTNDGLALTFQAGLVATIQGGYTNQTNVSLGTIDNAGTITLTGDWTNNSANTVFSTNTGTVQFIGTTAGQTISGANSTGFYNLTVNNTYTVSPQIILGVNTDIKNTLTMTAGKINLAGFTLTLGTAALTPGALSYTSGFMYGGNFKRWMGTATYAVTNVLGHFPMGTSVGDYRPFWLGITTVNLTTGGTVTLSHTGVYPTTYDVASHTDASWGGGTVLQGVSQSTWNVSTGDGLTSDPGTLFDIRFGGDGFGTNTLTDINASLAASTVGTFAAATNVISPIEGNRTGLIKNELDNTGGTQSFRLGTKDVAQSPLPIELLFFQAKFNSNNKIDVIWTTATETNNDYFTIEKTKNGIDFEIVGIVDGAGNSSKLLSYSTVDENPYSGISYYRLKQTDFDGKYKYSALVAVESNDKEFAFAVFPNPSNGNNINLHMNGVGDEILVVITDVLGRECYSKLIVFEKGNNIYAIDKLKNISPGVYWVSASSNDNIYSVKIIIQ